GGGAGSAGEGAVPTEQRPPRLRVLAVNPAHLRRSRLVGGGGLELPLDARGALRDLPPQLRLVHELRGHDALPRARRLRLDRRPWTPLLQVGPRIPPPRPPPRRGR